MKRADLNIFFILGLFAFTGSLSFAKSSTPIHGSISVKGKPRASYSSLAKITLQEAISLVGKETSGKVIEAALDAEDDVLVYEIEILMPDQNRREILIDAGNGKILLKKDKNGSGDGDHESDED